MDKERERALIPWSWDVFEPSFSDTLPPPRVHPMSLIDSCCLQIGTNLGYGRKRREWTIRPRDSSLGPALPDWNVRTAHGGLSSSYGGDGKRVLVLRDMDAPVTRHAYRFVIHRSRTIVCFLRWR